MNKRDWIIIFTMLVLINVSAIIDNRNDKPGIEKKEAEIVLNDSIPLADSTTDDYFWIDNNRFHKDSLIHCSAIYDAPNNKIGEVIRVSYGTTDIYIECVSEKGYTWQEWRDSFLNAFKEGSK